MFRFFLVAALAVSASHGFADTYTNTFTNTSEKQWIAWHVETTNCDSVNFSTPNIYNTTRSAPKWKIYFFEQGSNYFQRKGFLAYPFDGSNTQVNPGESLRVTFTYTPTEGLTPSFTLYGISWPLDGTTVTVTPENMQGWSIETNQGAKAGIVRYGPGYYEANRPLIAEEYNIHLGEGSFYAQLDYSGGPGSSATPATAWLGTDTHNGQPLAGITLDRIKTMKWFGFQSKIPCRTNHPSGWDNWDQWWIFPRQPICLELTVENPTDSSDRRQFWFRPFSTAKVSGDNCGRENKRWLWYDPLNGTPQVQVTRRWYCWRPGWVDKRSLDEVYGDWPALIAVYGSWKLVATSNDPWPTGYKSAGWDNTTNPTGSPTCTATGKCLNFQVGARKGYTEIYNCDITYPEDPYPVNWAGSYWGLRGNVDFFTFGVDLDGDGNDTDPGEMITYDFEPSPTEPEITIASINHKSSYDPIIGTPDIQGSIELRDCGPAFDHIYHRIYGKVVKVTNVYFELDDGTGRPIGTGTRVWLIRNINSRYDAASGYVWPGVGQWWTVWGWFEKVRFFPAVEKPYALWASYFNCSRLK